MATTINGLTGVSQIQPGTVTADDLASFSIGSAGPVKMQIYATKATTSGTSVDFSPADGTGIPSWAKKITVIVNGVSTNGTTNILMQVGSGSVSTSGYSGSAVVAGATNVVSGSTMTNAIAVHTFGNATNAAVGMIHIVALSGNTYIYSGNVGNGQNGYVTFGNGSITLSGAMDRIRFTTGNGTDVFDGGSVSILVEG